MVKLGLVQTTSYSSNQNGISKISEIAWKCLKSAKLNSQSSRSPPFISGIRQVPPPLVLELVEINENKAYYIIPPEYRVHRQRVALKVRK